MVINFKDEYASLGNASDPMQYIVTKDYDHNHHVYYHQNVGKSGVTFTFRMLKDSTYGVLLAVNLEHDKVVALISPVQLGSRMLGAVYEDRAVCYLKKI